MRTQTSFNFLNFFSSIGGFALVVVLWQVGVTLSGVPAIVVPSPMDVLSSFFEHWDRLARNVALTMTEAILGFLIALVVAYTSATLFQLSKSLKLAFYPLAIGLKTMPLITLAPIIVLWFGDGITSKIVMSALLAYFPILIAVVDGLGRIDASLLELMKSLNASKWQKFLYLRVPHSVPSLFSSLKIAAPISVVGAVIGEYVGSTSGIGHMINIESYYLNTDIVFAAIICISIASGLFFLTIRFIEKLVVYW